MVGMERIYENITDTFGNTPLVKIPRLSRGLHATILVKMESFNPAGSVKDRIGVSMIESAEREGRLRPDTVIIEPTSGNTGIALAFVAAAKGYRCILTMPDTMTMERRNLLKAYGAQVILTPGTEGMKGAIAKAQELIAATPGSWMPQQFENPANVEVHERTTAREIREDFPEGLDALITGVGTGGHITGCARVLKKAWPKLKVFAVEPTASHVISGGTHSPTRSRASARVSGQPSWTAS